MDTKKIRYSVFASLINPKPRLNNSKLGPTNVPKCWEVKYRGVQTIWHFAQHKKQWKCCSFLTWGKMPKLGDSKWRSNDPKSILAER